MPHTALPLDKSLLLQDWKNIRSRLTGILLLNRIVSFQQRMVVGKHLFQELVVDSNHFCLSLAVRILIQVLASIAIELVHIEPNDI